MIKRREFVTLLGDVAGRGAREEPALSDEQPEKNCSLCEMSHIARAILEPTSS